MTTLEAVGRDAGRARLPWAVAVTVLAVVAAVPVWSDHLLVTVPGLVSANLATLFGCDVLTAVLLVGRFRGGASPRLVVIAAGFAWSAMMVVGLALAVPGVLSSTPVISDPDALWWLWMSRHAVPPVFIAVALVPWPTSWRYGADVYDGTLPADEDDEQPLHGRLDRRLVLSALAVGAALVTLAAVGGSVFPAVSTASGAHGLGSQLSGGPVLVVVVVNVLAVVAAASGVALRRSGSALESWAVVAAIASLGDVLLTNLASPIYSIGYYAGRGLALAAAVMVLLFMLRDVFALHQRTMQDARRLQRQNSELLDAGRLRDHLVAVVSHEMRTPLTGLQGYLELLSAEDDLDDESVGRMLERSWLLTRRLTLLSEDLLAVAAVEHGDFVVIPETVRLAHQLDECAACFPDLDLRLDCPSDLMVYADTLRLQQVLNNLIRNAQKHGAEPVTVTCTNTRTDAGELVVIRVADSGPGVPSDFVHRLFERYAQGANQRAGGSGLGLSVVRDLVRAHGGSVRYDLTDPAFVVSLPRPVDTAPAHRAAPVLTADVEPATPVAPTSALAAFEQMSAVVAETQPAVGPQLIANGLSLTAKK